MGRFATGRRALGMSLGDEVKVLSEAPGPHRMMAWKPGEGNVAWGMVEYVNMLVLVLCREIQECRCPAKMS
jgi:hypothetical protein